MNILVATDGSKGAMAALRAADHMLKRDNRRVDLLHITPRRAVPKAYEKRIAEIASKGLRRIAAVIERAQEVRLSHALGSPAGVIVRKSEHYDLTVIGATGRRTTGSRGLGHVAGRVIAHAADPILVARELRSEDGFRVLIAVDGSTAAQHAIRALTELFDLAAAEICLMHVTETPWIELGLDEDWVTYSEEEKETSEAGAMQQELVREGGQVIEAARDLLRGINVSARFDEGNPANELLSEAERGQYDLVVVGATGVRDLKHQMLGSVSLRIAWDAPCSVLIVREPG